MPDTSTATVQEIPIEKITPSPYQARKSFDEEALKELADSMKSEGLIQPIIVRVAAAGAYELIAGERRLRAAKLLGWTAIDAIVQAGVNNQDAAMRGLIENLLRSDLNPIERAQGYKQLEDMGLSQEVIGSKMGVGQTTVARCLALLDIPEPIQELMPRGILSERHVRAIRQVPTLSDQIQLAKQADKEEWSAKETEKRVKQHLGKGPEAANSHKPQADSLKLAAGPDPLADVWPSLQTDVGLSVQAYWEVKYGVHKPDAKGAPMNGWFFFVKPREWGDAKAKLAEWHRQMASALEPGNRQSAIGNGGTMPDMRSPMPGLSKPRLPQTPAEEKELQEIAAKQGPKAVYVWIYGANSPLIQMTPKTWEEVGSNPTDGLRQILDGIRRFQGMSAPVAPISPAEADEEPLDPEIAAMVARQVAQGRVL